MDQDNDNNQIHCLCHSAYIYSLLSLYLIVCRLMPPKSKEPGSPTKKPTAKWNTVETEALISFLRSESSRIGGTSFKEATFTTAADHIKHHLTEGPIKTAAHCRTKWAAVSFLYSLNDNVIDNAFFHQLKAKFNTVERLASSSGASTSFNPRTGSSATTTSEQSVIDDFAASNLVSTSAIFKPYLTLNR